MRHALGALGVLAAGVLLAVSAAMNWRFGYQLGVTEFDSHLYASASAAADCLKALVPFLIFAAIKNRMWSQALASGFVWVVVTVYSLTSALGYAALNRGDTSGKRANAVQTYKDLRSDLDRAKSQLSWVPAHRPAATAQADLNRLSNQRRWKWTKGCTSVKGRSNRRFCDNHAKLGAELASANEAAKLEIRIASVQANLTKLKGVTHSSADPQATVLAKLAGLVWPGVKVENVQTALAIFIALLLEVGSGLGMYIAFSQWKLDPTRTVYPRRENEVVQPLAVNDVQPLSAEPIVVERDEAVATITITKPGDGANDNIATPKLAAPTPDTANDVERFREKCIEDQPGSTLTAQDLYEEYCTWCDEQQKEPLALPTFGREFGELGVQKAKVSGRVRYIGIALRSVRRDWEDTRDPVTNAKVA
jgi:hypothetical protein